MDRARGREGEGGANSQNSIDMCTPLCKAESSREPLQGQGSSAQRSVMT